MTTGVAFNYDAPGARPPQTRAARGRAARAASAGSVETLEQTLLETLELAQPARRRPAGARRRRAAAARAARAVRDRQPRRRDDLDRLLRGRLADGVDHVLDAARAATRGSTTSRPACRRRRTTRSGCSRGSGRRASSRARTRARRCRRALRLERSPLARFRPARRPGRPQPYRSDVPLEALVEREPVQRFADPRRDLRVAAEAGLYFLRLLERFKVVGRRPRRRSRPRRGSQLPETPAAEDDDAGRRYLAVMARPRARRLPRLPGARADAPRRPRRRRSCRRAGAAGGRPRRRPCRPGVAFLDWFDARYSIAPAGAARRRRRRRGSPSGSSTRSPSRRGRATASSALTAPEYPGGTLDWYSFDADPALTLGVEAGRPASREPVVRTVVPAPVRYSGMAADRWWEFEDGQRQPQPHRGRPRRADAPAARRVRARLRQRLVHDPGRRDARRASSGRSRSSSPTRSASGRSSRTTRARRGRSPSGGCSRSARPARRARTRSSCRRCSPAACTATRSRRSLFIRDELANLVWAVERLAPSIAGGALNRAERYRDPRPDPVAQPPDERDRRRRATASRRPCPTTGSRSSRCASTRASRTSASAAPRRCSTTAASPASRSRSAASSSPSAPDLSLFEEEVPRGGVRVDAPVPVHALGRRLDVPVARPPQGRRRAARARAACASTSSTRPDGRCPTALYLVGARTATGREER